MKEQTNVGNDGFMFDHNSTIPPTAVEFLRKVYEEQHGALYGEDFEEAEKIEKHHIIKAHTNAYLVGEDSISVEDAKEEGEKYYKNLYR